MKRALVALMLFRSSLALAHGGLPVSQSILRQGDSDTMYVPVVYWGVWVGQPGGPWKWICEELINGYRFRKFALSGDGTFYATDLKGITLSTDHGCTWTHLSGPLAQLHASDVVADPVDAATAWVTTGDGGSVLPDGGVVAASNALYVTHDHGTTWTPLAGLAAQASRILQSVRVAPSDAHTVYVTSGAQTMPFSPSLHASTDGGSTFATLPLTYVVDGVVPHAFELLAIDPRNPAVVWARVVALVPASTDSVERQALLRSSDGGATWSELARIDAVTEPSGQTRGIDSVAFDLANHVTYAATRSGLIAGSDTGSAAVPTLAPTGGLAQTQCVDVHGGAVYACSSQFPPDNAAIARSTDVNGHAAQNFSSVLNYVDTVGPVDCPAGTPVGDMCPLYWYMYGAQLGISFDGGSATPDGAMMPPQGRGCGCSIGAVESAVGGLGCALFVLAVAIRTGARSGARARRRG